MNAKYFWPSMYLLAIVVANWMMVSLPMINILGAPIPMVMFVVGFVFILRDFTQRHLGHWVFPIMIAAVVISYFTSTPAVAVASASAFAISEFIDWAVYTYTKKPLADRILVSSAIACPIDTLIFLTALGIYNAHSFWIVSALKFSSAVVCYFLIVRIFPSININSATLSE